MRLGRARKKRATYCGRTRHAKIRYRTLKDAKRARIALERHVETGVRIYGCPLCDGYHLTTEAQYQYGNPRTVWEAPHREISSEEGLT